MFLVIFLFGLFPLHILSRFDIDVVYTWVQQPNRTKYDLIREICPDSHGNNIQRFRDTGTLYYSLRSVLRYLPWIRHIFLVTNGEGPCWLREMDKISIVSHSEIWPQSTKRTELPTFNSIPIESHLHRIKGLSEHFIYLNDDMFVGTYLPPSYFFNLMTGVPHVNVKDMFWLPYELLAEENFIWGRESSYSLNTTPGYVLTQLHYPDHDRMRPRPFPGAYMGTHGPYMCTISLIKQIQSLWPQYFQHLSSQRCRSATNTQPVYSGNPSNSSSSHPPYRPPFWIYQWYQIVSNISLPIERNVPFLNMFHLPVSFYDSILSKRIVTEFFILNDDYSLNQLKGDLDIKQQQLFLESYYGWNSLNSYLSLNGKNWNQKEKLFDDMSCQLIRDQSYFTITQRRKFFNEEKNIARKGFLLHSNTSDPSAIERYHQILKYLSEDSREIDPWLTTTTTSPLTQGDRDSTITTSAQLTLNSFIFPPPLEVGHYSDNRDGLSSGPFSYEGRNNLQLHIESSNSQSHVELSLILFDGLQKSWRENCERFHQFHSSSNGFLSLVRNILPISISSSPIHQEKEEKINSLYHFANCLHLNYLRGTRSENNPIRNRQLGFVFHDYDRFEWGIVSSFPLRDMRRYELEFSSEELMNRTLHVPLLVTSIPVSFEPSVVSRHPSPDWSEIVYNSSDVNATREEREERTHYWIDIWYMLPFPTLRDHSESESNQLSLTTTTRNRNKIRTRNRRRMSKRSPTQKQLKIDLLELIEIRRMKRKETSLASVFVGVTDSPSNYSVGTIWSEIEKLFHSDRYDGSCQSATNNSQVIVCGTNSDIGLLFSRQILDILLKFSVNIMK